MESTSFDQLISRALDGGARTGEWDALERAVRCEPALAAELVRGLRIERGLESALGPALGAAERVALPRARGLSLGRHSGWLAAAAIALCWTASAARGPVRESGHAPVGEPIAATASAPSHDSGAPAPDSGALASPDALRRLGPGESSPGTNNAPGAPAPGWGGAPGGTPALASLDAPFESLGELPLQMLHSRALESGRYEVLFVRPMLQRTVVDGALELARDELGEPHFVPVRLAADEARQDL